MIQDKRIAVLIDAENVSSKYADYIFDEISKYGTPTYKRIYGDWTSPNLGSWKKDTLLNHSIAPIQQYSYTSGKSSTDSGMIIDAMDILYSSSVDGFCLVSSDSDFTKLAARLREAGKLVIGMGEKKTPIPFIKSCEKFVFLEVIKPSDEKIVSIAKNEKENAKKVKKELSPQEWLIVNLEKCINETSSDDGWAFLSDVGNRLSKLYPEFDSRSYGFKKFSMLVKSLKEFEVISRKDVTNSQIAVYLVKIK